MATLATVNNSNKPGKLVFYERQFSHECQSIYSGRFNGSLDQTMNIHFLSPLQWLIVLTGTISTPFHPGKTLYNVPQGSSIPGKQFSHELQLTFWPFVLDQIMNRDFLSLV